MLAGAKQEGTSDVAYSRNQPSVLEDDREPQRQSGARSGAPQTSNPRRIADFRRSRYATPESTSWPGQSITSSGPPRTTPGQPAALPGPTTSWPGQSVTSWGPPRTIPGQFS